ncbi:chromo domain-containing protein LHP1-like [Macadamia integrifolia]|uniref:chromo domain-containing protein LHP1-like n=1 Tax=Macadamia integrifolia TaxID=60698 RepID=UPI001C4F2A5A|nr:chromo domain-containing protein LHP1-like [Macadamia integrifolia]XP_042488773.1 chromo domain-containing protein LHP1-like [Macadamia integrifolia]
MKGGRKKTELPLAPRPNDKDSKLDGAGGGGAACCGDAGGVTVVVGVGAEGAVGRNEEEMALATAEEDNEEEGEDEGIGKEDGEVGAAGERPKLDEGFYEIEDVRRKRVRKGQVQYLIKWRGWPEAANTWEPFENLQSCYDVIEAFEESRHTGTRKRKRKSGTPHSQPKRKQRSTPNSSVVKLKETVDVLLSSTPDNTSLASLYPPEGTEAGNATEGKTFWDADNMHEDVNNEKPTQQPNDNGSLNVSLEPVLSTEANGADPKLSELKGIASDQVNNDKFTIHIPDARTTKDGLSKAEDVEPDRNSRFTGAKRRKTGSVKRFKQESVSSGRVQNSTALCGIISSGRVEPQGIAEAGTMGEDTGEKTKSDYFTSSSSIAKIIKVVGYSASISNNVQDASVNFLVLRSDGKEMVVDNEFLKTNNPLLLISYYEQHLRYSPPK